MMVRAISDILNEAGAQKSVPLKVKYLQDNCKDPVVRQFLAFVSNPNTTWALPEGTPPFTPFELDEPGLLYAQVRRLYVFTKEGHPTLSNVRREQLFVELLQSISKADAEMICGIKDGKFPKGLSPKIVWRAFPEMNPHYKDDEDAETAGESTEQSLSSKPPEQVVQQQQIDESPVPDQLVKHERKALTTQQSKTLEQLKVARKMIKQQQDALEKLHDHLLDIDILIKDSK